MPRLTKRLLGRVALITGASRGIGAAVAKQYAAEGAQVILTARTIAGLEEVDDAIQAASNGQSKATLVPLDLKDQDEIQKLAPAISKRFGKLDILVGNAGILGEITPVPQIEQDNWEEVNHAALLDNISNLDRRSQDIIRTRWLEDNKLTLNELADRYSVSAERIRQIEAKAFKKLKTALVNV